MWKISGLLNTVLLLFILIFVSQIKIFYTVERVWRRLVANGEIKQIRSGVFFFSNENKQIFSWRLLVDYVFL